MFNIFKKTCSYCRTAIEKGKELKKAVKVPGYVGTRERNFCCEEHANKYAQEVEEHLKKSRKSGGGCCG